MPAFPKRPGGDHAAPAVRAALRAREVAGDDEAAGGDARRDAFAALLYGLAIGFASREDTSDDLPDSPLVERVPALATALLRAALGLGFRDATRCVEAIADGLVADRPDPALVGLVQAGAAAAADWQAGDESTFATRVLHATAGESFASEHALRPRR
jgi:hypothetical protein